MEKTQSLNEKSFERGDKIPADFFFVSEHNIRIHDDFGESKEDIALIEHLRNADLVQPFKARPENSKLGVFFGRRRYLAAIEAGKKEFIFGKDVLIEDIAGQDALSASLRENLSVYRKQLDPVTRAKALNIYLAHSTISKRQLARIWGIPATTLGEWLKPLELSEAMQEVLRRGLITFREALRVYRLNLGSEKQVELARAAEEEPAFFKAELNRITANEKKRGIRKDVYLIVKSMFDKRNRRDLQYYERLNEVAKEKHITLAQYAKDVLIKHLDTLHT